MICFTKQVGPFDVFNFELDETMTVCLQNKWDQNKAI